MKYRTLAIGLALVVGSPGNVYAAEHMTNEDKAAKLAAAYESVCTQWATENELSGDARDQYISWCVEQMPMLRPVGPGDNSPGGE